MTSSAKLGHFQSHTWSKAKSVKSSFPILSTPTLDSPPQPPKEKGRKEIMAKFNLRALLVVLGAMLLISNNVANAEEGGSVTVEAVVSDNGEVVVESDADSINPADKEAEEKDPEDPKCPSRPHIIRCAAATLDKNKNNKLERKELQEGIDSLPWLSRGVLKIIGSVDKIMAKCDADGDDAIGMIDDMEKTKDQCLATCFKRRAFKSAFFPDCEL